MKISRNSSLESLSWNPKLYANDLSWDEGNKFKYNVMIIYSINIILRFSDINLFFRPRLYATFRSNDEGILLALVVPNSYLVYKLLSVELIFSLTDLLS